MLQVYAFDRCFEGAVAAFATPLVGLISERMFGFSGASTVTGDPKIDVPNAVALGSALLAFLAVPWMLCFFIYSGLHWTYPHDRRTALVVARGKTADYLRVGSYEEDVRLLSTANGSGGGGRPSSVSQRVGSSLLEERTGLLHPTPPV